MRGAILTPAGFVDGTLDIDAQGRIGAIEGLAIDSRKARESGMPLVLPGFIDLHVHGGGGRDIMEGGDAARSVARLHAAHGTTALLATTMTAPPAELASAFGGLAATLADGIDHGARVLGVHLEGPYISGARLGAQPDHARPVDLDELGRLHAQVPIRLLTLAPEIAANMALIPALCRAGHVVQIGHTLGSYEHGVQALQLGARGFTHLFNAMSGMHHREPGMVGAALAHADYAEIIPDLLHSHAGALRVALRAIPHLFCVTDSTAAAGMPDGEYRLGSQTVRKCLGGVRLADGTLAGSTLTMDQALRNLVDTLQLDLPDAARRVSTHAADFLGLEGRGRLSRGAFADLVLLDRDLQLQDVFLEGVALDARRN
ncbi:MAG: N-acetylglucosamine-6-phosphate deacetylase [Pseudomonadota bacterium]|nr:N-acetylglucosamine-6-phosphate deacetylase [Pseudomonadota bacterium]